MPDEPKPLTAEEMDIAERCARYWRTAPTAANYLLRAIHQIRALTDRIAALEAESRAFRAAARHEADVASQVMGEKLQAEERIAALEADRARLDKFERALPAYIGHIRESECAGDFVLVEPNNGHAAQGKTLRAAIDALQEPRP